MKKLILFLLLFSGALMAQTPNTLNWYSSDASTRLKGKTAPNQELMLWYDSLNSSGSLLRINTTRIQASKLAGRNDGNVTGKVIWLDPFGIIKVSPKDSLGISGGGGGSTVITPNRVAVGGNSGTIRASGVIDTLELNSLDGNTLSIPTQFAAKQPISAELTAIASLSGTGLLKKTGVGAYAFANSADINTILGFTPVADTRSIIAGFGLSGGGNLTADRTVRVDTTKIPYANAIAANGTFKRLNRKWVFDSTSSSVPDGSPSTKGIINLYNTTAGSSTTGAPDQNSVNLALVGKQENLVSGTNIKTINGNSILGSGDIAIGGGGSTNISPNRVAVGGNSGSIRASNLIDTTELNYLDGIASNIQTQLNGKQAAWASAIGNQFVATDVSNIVTAVPSLRAMDNFDLPDQNRRKLWFSGRTAGFGDSFLSSSSPNVPSTQTLIEVLKKRNNWSYLDRTLGGTGAYYAAQQSMVLPPKYTGNILIGFGLNDINNGITTPTINKILCGYRTVILGSWLDRATAASAAVSSGTWSNYTAITTKSATVLSGNARSATVAGATLTYTSPISDNVLIGCFGSDGTSANYGRFSVTIDGTNKGTYTPNGQTDGLTVNSHADIIINNVLVFKDLGAGAHTVVITLLDNLLTPVDYFGVLQSPQNMPRVLALGTWSHPLFVSSAITSSAAVKALVGTLSTWPIAYVDPNRSYNLTTGLGADGSHPNTIGNFQIANEIQKHIEYGSNMVNDNFVWQRGSVPTYMGGTGPDNNFTITQNLDGNSVTANPLYCQTKFEYFCLINGSGFRASTSTAPNTAAVTTFETNDLGQTITAGVQPRFNARASYGVNNGGYFGSEGNAVSSYIGNQVYHNGTGYIAAAANAGLYRLAGISHVFYGSSGNTIGASYDMTKPIATLDGGAQNIFIGAASPIPAGINGGLLFRLGTAQTSDISVGGVGMWAQLRNSVVNSDGLNLRVGTGSSVTPHVFGPLFGVGISIPAANLHVSQAIQLANHVPAFKIDAGTHGTIAASTELNDVFINVARGITYNAGALPLSRSVRISSGPVIAFTTPSTLTTASTFSIGGAPTAGVNATITNPLSFLVESGNSSFAGRVGVGTVSPQSRLNSTGSIMLDSLKGLGNRQVRVRPNGILYDTLIGAGGGTAYTFSTGLTNTANTITANLATGVSGGQTAIGGTASGNSLTLSSTSNATKGSILFGNSAYDEANNRLGIGVASPTSNLHVVQTGGITPSIFVQGGTQTGLAASTEVFGFVFAPSGGGKTWASGAISQQREFVIGAPTYQFASASTITDAATFAIASSPTAGANATITNSYALWVQNGQSKFGGDVIGKNGFPLPQGISNMATLDFPSTGAMSVSDLTVTVTGANVGDVVAIGVPNGSVVASGSFSAWVSASNTVTIRYANNDGLTPRDPASGTFKAMILR
jgi:hypothetical protein